MGKYWWKFSASFLIFFENEYKYKTCSDKILIVDYQSGNW